MMFLVFLFVFFSNGGKLKYFFVYSIMIEEFFFSFFLRFIRTCEAERLSAKII
jgi:hypothetical protein